MPEPVNAVAAATHADPYPYYARLVRERPFVWDDAVGAWVAASAAAVEAVLGSPICRVRPPGEPVPAALAGTAAGEVFARLARMSDGPQHRARRLGATSGIAALDLAAAESLAARWTRALWTERGGWPVDAGFRLPVCVVARMLGVPESRLADVCAWATAFVRGVAPGAGAEAVGRGACGAARLMELFGENEVRRAPPLCALAEALAGADEPDARTAAANAIGLLFQSHDATAGLLGNAIVALGERPEIEREVRARPELLPELIREVLRYDPPVQNTRRWVAEDSGIAGHRVRAGDPVLVLLAAANRDPAVDPHADVFQLRQSVGALSLGHGAHACPGGALAVTIAATALRTMLEMGADLSSLAAGRTYLPSVNGRIPLFG